MLGAGPAFADPQFAVLHDHAIAVSDPAGVLLISVARAGARLVAVGEHGVIIYSDDNGQSWRQAAVPVDVSLTTVGFATAQDGWAGGDYGVVLHTADGGASWQARAVRRAGIFAAAGPDKPFLSVVAFSPARALIFGAYRMTVVTNDAGRSWEDWSLHVGDPVSHNLYDTAWNGTSLYAVGEAGAVLRSDDQGASFKLLPAPTDSTLLGVLGVGDGGLLTYGVAGAAFRSVDGGQSWSPVPVATQVDLTAAVTLRSGQVVLVSEDGEVFVSTDRAVSFHALAANQGMSLFGVTQAANGDVVFVGTGGVRVVPPAALH